MKKMLFMLAVCLCMIPAGVHAADLGRQTLGTNDGWGAASGGTTGGAKASSSNVYTVSNRQQLVSALGGSANSTPKIIYIQGTINMNTDDRNKTLGFNDYKDPAYDPNAYLKAYDPDKWGKKRRQAPRKTPDSDRKKTRRHGSWLTFLQIRRSSARVQMPK